MVDKIIAKLKPRSAPFNVRFFLYIAPEIYTKTKPIIKSASSPTNSVEENGNFKINLIKITKHPALGPYINEVIKAGISDTWISRNWGKIGKLNFTKIYNNALIAPWTPIKDISLIDNWWALFCFIELLNNTHAN